MRNLVDRVPPAVWQMVRYLLVGGSAFVIDFGSLALLKSGFGVPAWLSAAIAFALSTLYSFLLQRKFTFSADLRMGNSAIRYGILLAVNMALTSVIVEGFDRFFGLYLLGKIVSTALTTIWNFPIMKYWVYPRSATETALASREMPSDKA
ncbi:MAG: GtrA family protein [Propionibacterium sp.]|nr:GtrA family protein [Propionibacterium sp.]